MPMHVAQISFFSDPAGRAPQQLLRDWPSLGDVAESAARAAARVTVLQACRHSQELTREDIVYHFMPFGGRHARSARLGLFDGLLRELAPDVFHVHGLDFPRDILSLAKIAPKIPILLQDHASRPPKPWRRTLWRRSFAAASGVAFCSLDQSQPFASVGLFAPQTKIYAIPESTSRFTPGDSHGPRETFGLFGNPLILWVGHLDKNKDPLTVLEGISKAARELPQLQLFCCFGNAPLMPAIYRRLADDPHLRDRVHLLGRVPHAHIEQIMRAADLFVLGSHREGSGYSVIEALACGLPPVITDIPSFRALIGAGAAGALWPTGDAHALFERVLSLAAQPRAALRAAARRQFEAELSFDAVGRKLVAAYEDLLNPT